MILCHAQREIAKIQYWFETQTGITKTDGAWKYITAFVISVGDIRGRATWQSAKTRYDFYVRNPELANTETSSYKRFLELQEYLKSPSNTSHSVKELLMRCVETITLSNGDILAIEIVSDVSGWYSVNDFRLHIFDKRYNLQSSLKYKSKGSVTKMVSRLKSKADRGIKR